MLWQVVEACAAGEKQRASEQEQRAARATPQPACQRRRRLPGLGPCSATALVAAVSEASACQNGRPCAAWLGLVPRQAATGGQERLLGRSNRGASSRRTLLLHGARATRRWVGRTTDRRSPWMRQVVERRGTHRTAGALAHTHARMVGALLTSPQASEPAKGSSRRRSWGAPSPRSAKGGSVPKTRDTSRIPGIVVDRSMQKAFRTMRGVSALMTRSVRPASSQPA
jgi:hypothetical protein